MLLEPRLLERLVGIVGGAHVRTDPDQTAAATRDWTGRFHGSTPAVVRPADTDQVAAVLAVCHSARVAVVPQGGNTGLVGGGVPLHGEVVLDLRRLDQVGPVDVRTRQLTVGAGVTVAAVHQAAAAHHLSYAVDLAARDSATVGGTIATNAGGVHVLRWGMTRQQLVGIEAVRADGTVLAHLGGLAKDNTGYDLAGLLCGSEGTLAVITAARLRLVPAEPDRAVALVSVGSVAEAVDLVADLAGRLAGLTAAELMVADGVELVCRTFDRAHPGPGPAFVLLEVRAGPGSAPGPTPGSAVDRLGAALATDPRVVDSAVATSEADRARLWSYREDHTLAINTLGPPHKLDVTLPLGGLAAFVDRVGPAVASAAPGSQLWLFGHLGDGNLHVNVTGVAPEDDSADDAVLELVVDAGGSISAEHGIGTAKRAWLARARTAAEIETFRAIKAALDPHGILNPHVLLPD